MERLDDYAMVPNRPKKENPMTEVRVQIPDTMMRRMQSRDGYDLTPESVVLSALTLFVWAVAESARKRFIFSTDQDGHDVSRCCMPSLTRAYERAVA